MDLGFSGPKFTWLGNKANNCVVMERLDRVCVIGNGGSCFLM